MVSLVIGDLVVHLCGVLDATLAGDVPGERRVVVPTSGRSDTDPFQADAVTLLIVNVEEDRLLRPPNPHERRDESGVSTVAPDLRLDLHMLLVARFARYDQSWTALSSLLRHFQTHPVVDRITDPALPDGIDRLAFTLQTLSLAEQAQLWGFLRTAYLPSLAYRVSMLTFTDTTPTARPLVTERRLDLAHIPGRDS
jgi:hypothetical protein